MKLKWYISALIIALTLLGVGQHHIAVPNQEIVLQYSDDINAEVTTDALNSIKTQLQKIGANNIKVQEEQGRLRITYYSTINVSSIKELLLSNNLELDYTASSQTPKNSQEPLKKETASFNFDVFEIQKGEVYSIDFDGFVLEQKPETPRFYSPNLYFSHNVDEIKESNNIDKVNFIVQRNIALAIDNTSHKIPEVRAGPSA